MYPLDAGLWGPTARIIRLKDELERLVDLDVIEGYRPAPPPARPVRHLGKHAGAGWDLCGELDLSAGGGRPRVPRACPRPRIPWSAIRDAYQLFAEYYPLDSLKRRLGQQCVSAGVRALRAVSNRLAFPTAGLADAVVVRERRCPPPPARSPAAASCRRPTGSCMSGTLAVPAQGADRLIAAVASHGARAGRGAGRGQPRRSRPVTSAPAVDAHSPRRGRRNRGAPARRDCHGHPAAAGPYNDLALPIKLFDYLSYGRPLSGHRLHRAGSHRRERAPGS